MSTINVGLSQQANQLLTHHANYHMDALYAGQMDEDSAKTFIMRVQNNMANYYPRNIFVDYANGTGALEKHSFFDVSENSKQNANSDPLQLTIGGAGEQTAAPDTPSNEVYEQIPTGLPLVKSNDYQKSLDAGRSSDLDRVDYWSDFSNVINLPNNILTIKDYVYDPTTGESKHKDLGHPFMGLDLGKEVFNADSLREDIEETVRMNMEDCDSLRQLNIVVDLDSAWSGFSVGVLDDIIDYQLNGSSIKIVYWGLMQSKLDNTSQRCQRVESVLDLEERVGCFIPLGLNRASSWQTTSLLSLPFYDLANTNLDRIQDLTQNYQYKYITKVNVNNVNVSPWYFHESKAPYHNVLSQIQMTSKANTRLSYKTLSSDVQPMAGSSMEFIVDDSLRDQWSLMAKFVKGVYKGDQRGDMLEQLGNLKERYSYGYEGYSDYE